MQTGPRQAVAAVTCPIQLHACQGGTRSKTSGLAAKTRNSLTVFQFSDFISDVVLLLATERPNRAARRPTGGFANPNY